jgi:AP-3 complex subunit delta-1
MGKSMYEAGLAINCLANICTPDLARDLAPDIVSMLTSSRPYIRKRAVLVLYKIFLKFPDALRPSFNRLKEKLEDPDPCTLFLFSLSFFIFRP